MLTAVRANTHGRLRMAALAVCFGVLLVGCDDDGAADERGAAEGHSQGVLMVDEARGTVGGVRLGDSPDRVRELAGAGRCVEGDVALPLGEDDVEIGGPYSGEGYRERDPEGASTVCAMRYPRLAVTVFVPDGAISVVTSDPRARTRGGVGVRDSAEAVEERYPGARCAGFQDTGDVDSIPGGCSLPPAPSRDGVTPPRLFFGLDEDGEEVRSIWLEATSWEGIERLRRR